MCEERANDEASGRGAFVSMSAASAAATKLTKLIALISRLFVHNVQERLTALETAQVLGEERDEWRPVVCHGTRCVRRHDRVRQIPVGACAVERLMREHIQ